jgi:hypothetical protein
MNKEIPTKEELALSVDVAEWQWLKPHMERGSLIIVSEELELAEAAFRVATDDAAIVQAWIQAGKIGKPQDDDIEGWNAVPTKRFKMLIISPYILIQAVDEIVFNA